MAQNGINVISNGLSYINDTFAEPIINTLQVSHYLLKTPLYSIGRHIRTTIKLYSLGRPVIVTITMYHIRRPVLHVLYVSHDMYELYIFY